MPSGPVVMRCVRVEGIRTGLDPSGMWLKSWDPDGGLDRGGRAEWTVNPRRALVFPSAREGFEAWRAVPRARPIRPDGKPNRPLTAYTVTFDPAPAAGAL